MPQFEQNITLQENALRILTGTLPGKVERSTTLEQIPVPAGLYAGVPSAILSRRPDVKSAELSLVVADASLSLLPPLKIFAPWAVSSAFQDDFGANQIGHGLHYAGKVARRVRPERYLRAMQQMDGA